MKKRLLIPCLFFLFHVLVYAQEHYESKIIIFESTSQHIDHPNDLGYELTKNASLPEQENERLQQIFRFNKQFALFLFQSAIYGYEFSYTPSDTLRNIEEQWIITPIISLPEEDPRIQEISRDVIDNNISVIYRYNLSTIQVQIRQAWNNTDIFSASGKGELLGEGMSEIEAKKTVLLDAIENAIRTRLIAEIPNKPLKVVGSAKIIDQPFIIESGEYYTAKVKVRVKINTIQKQQVF